MKKLAATVMAFTLATGSFVAGDLMAAPYGWRHSGPGGYYYQDKQVDRTVVEKSAKAILMDVTKGESWKTPRGITQIPLINKDKLIVGNLWEDADPKALEIGAYWTGGGGTRVELVSSGKVVGMLWVQ